MILYVLRHGVAEAVAAEGDEARRLSDEGRDKTRKAAEGLKAIGVKFDVILTSPLARAAETAEIIAAAYPSGTQPRTLEALAAGVSPVQTVTALKPFLGEPAVMVVGHEPGLSRLCSLLLTGAPDGIVLMLKKAGCVALETNSLSVKGDARLLWMMTSRQLRALRKQA